MRSGAASRWKAFVHAWRGIVVLIRSQWNARVHLAATIAACALGFWFQVARWEWCALILAIGSVWAAEALNTAVEILADRITREQDAAIGRAKDVAAGAVLGVSVCAAAVGGVVFLPRIYVAVFS